MNISRRGFLSGILASGVAPVIIRTPGLIMPIKPLQPDFAVAEYEAEYLVTTLTPAAITREALRILHTKLNFISKINLEYDESFALRVGDTIRIRKPETFSLLRFAP